jgi:hypothetical protein
MLAGGTNGPPNACAQAAEEAAAPQRVLMNVNAFFELGVRYALKPPATICIGESGFKNRYEPYRL